MQHQETDRQPPAEMRVVPDAVVPDASTVVVDSSYRTPIGDALKAWGPAVLTAIVVPGGILIALVMVARKWYRRRADANALLARGNAARA